MEVAKLLLLLYFASLGHPGFHAIAQSLPHFGFFEGVKKRGFAVVQHAEVCVSNPNSHVCQPSVSQTCHKLMQALRYTGYGKVSVIGFDIHI